LLGTDADGDTLSLVSAGPGTIQSGTVTTNLTWVFYTRPSGFTNADSFSYSVNDTRGGGANGAVTVSLTTDSTSTPNYTVIDLGGGAAQLNFSGIPGRNYVIQFSPASGPVTWSLLTTRTAGTFGSFTCLDNAAGGPTARVYRAIEAVP
jgi:hypothetical protein